MLNLRNKNNESKPLLKEASFVSIERKKKAKIENRLIKPAHYREVDTGNKREIDIIKPDGQREKKIIPIIDRVFEDAVRESVSVETEVFAVADGEEEHEFASESDALLFLRQNGKA